ncbi:MAG: Ig-like domain-containing protein [Anaerolineae bacterium]
MKKKTIVFTIVVAGLCSLVAMASAAGIWYLRQPRQADAGPKVLIQSLRHGQQVAIGQRLPIQVTASAESNIKRIELWVDGNLYEAQTSIRAEGAPLLPMTAYWQPDSPGTHTLIARAFDAQDNRVSVSVQVTGILQSAQDDDESTLSDDAGVIEVNVSADTDNDDVPNAADPCPDEAGPAGSDGCPTPSEDDQDGDGLFDDEDLCPDIPGGSMTYGCPDGDGDGVRDEEDICADQPGLPINDGCPPLPVPTPLPSGDDEEDDVPVPKSPGDADDDGVPDEQDLCPEVEGAAENGGCPPGPDRDGDGIADEWDPCPDEAGLPEHVGCPPPSPGTSARPDDLPGWGAEGPGGITGPLVEFQAQAFEVDNDNDYDDVYCYVRLEDLDVGRHVLTPQGARQWDLAAALGSQHVVVEDDLLDVMIECGALVYDPAGETLPTHYDLGTMTASHSSSDWDGHLLFASSNGGEGVQFNMEYRLCLGTCDETAFPPPVLQLYEGSTGQYLGWAWSGDRAEIDGFHVFVDGNHVTDVFGDANVTSVSRYIPSCGRGHTFTVSAFRLGWGESPQSNQVAWTADPCPRVVRVTFYQLHTYDIGGPGLVGPVFGSFGAWSESDGETLAFNGSDYPDGVGFAPNSIYSVQAIFDSIRAWLEDPCFYPGCSLSPAPRCDRPFVSAPEVDQVTIELGPDDDLTFGGTIYIQFEDTYLELFSSYHTLPAGEVTPGYYTLYDGEYRLDVIVDVLVGPEAGDKPDLVVSRIVNHEDSGQLRVYVFNNAADLVDGQVEITFQRISTGQILGVDTWEGVTIPSGGEAILQTGFPVDAHDLRITLDPDDDIDEMDDDNNIYEAE